MRTLHVQSYVGLYMSFGRFLHSPDTIAHAKVSGTDSISWRTHLNLTPESGLSWLLRLNPCAILFLYNIELPSSKQLFKSLLGD